MNPAMARARAELIRRTRSFFDERSYLEVDTPHLAPQLIPEPHLEVFATSTVGPDGSEQQFLVPSPEVWMKELLVDGYGDIYQISHCFRNGETSGPIHAREFTMLEWYTMDADYSDSADLTEEFLEYVCSALSDRWPEAVKKCRPPALRLTMQEAFDRYAGMGPAVLEDPSRLADAARKAGLAVTRGEETPDAADDLFQRLFLTCVEEQLPRDRPVILTDYPALVPTLARSTGPTAERWELYLRGIEIANCYSEERDAGRLESYLQDAAGKKRRARVPHPPCAGIVRFSAAGRCSGVALGMDRLLMALSGNRDIRDVIFSLSFGIFREPYARRGPE